MDLQQAKAFDSGRGLAYAALQQMLRCSKPAGVETMMPQVQEFVAERAAAIAGQVRKARRTSVQSARVAARGSAESIKSLKSPVRVVARSGVKLTTVSQAFSQNLIELQTDMVTAAIGDVALRLERAARAESLVDLFRDQLELVPATRVRIVGDAQRAAGLVRGLGREVRGVATQAIERFKDIKDAAPAAPATKRKARKSARKTATRTRKAA
jgi:hypothetical protein